MEMQKKGFLHWLESQNFKKINGCKIGNEDILISSNKKLPKKYSYKNCIMEEHSEFILYVRNVQKLEII